MRLKRVAAGDGTFSATANVSDSLRVGSLVALEVGVGVQNA